MAYTRPSASAADLTWFGASAYTRPAANAANLSFPPDTIFTATGFVPTTFGTPEVIRSASGFSTTVIPTPLAGYWRTQEASGFLPTQLGSSLVGFASFPAAGFAPVVIPGAYYAFPQAGTAHGLRVTVAIPAPTVSYTIADAPAATSTLADATYTTEFGLPTALGANSNVASPVYTVAFGTPATVQTYTATGLFSTALGTPSTTSKFVASGLRTTQLPTPTCMRVAHPESLNLTRFGTPRSTIGGHIAAKLIVGRLGVPRATQSTGRGAAETHSTAFGTPTAYSKFNALPLVGYCHIGKPRVVRGIRC